MTLTKMTCRSCKAPMLMARIGGGGFIPLDPEPVEGGNIVVREDGSAIVIPEADRGGTRPLYITHFATCPNAAQHRKVGR